MSIHARYRVRVCESFACAAYQCSFSRQRTLLKEATCFSCHLNRRQSDCLARDQCSISFFDYQDRSSKLDHLSIESTHCILASTASLLPELCTGLRLGGGGRGCGHLETPENPGLK